MNNIFKMDMHRLLHSKVFYVSIAFLLAMAVGQIMGGMSTTMDALMGVALTGDAGTDFMSSAMGAGVIYILISIIIAIFVCGDYAGGFAKNLFAVHADPKEYVGGKMFSMAVVSALMLVLYAMIALPVLGYDVVLSGGVLGLIVFLLEKWMVGCAMSAVVLLVSFFTRNMAWTMFVGFLIATGGLTMGISLFAQAFGLEWIETVFSVLISGAAKLCSMQFDPIILLRVLVTCGVWTVAAYVCGKKVLLKKDI
ncbi:hypothetical protein [Pseudoflavonifractor sp. MCC625]|uniref:hypothetical protein n=1 Tax=Pseudoflavonifractor sp. MCC625 TaxID=2592647 RepID=UPI001C039728|nr:hypothetical protein [Pseudoflavonifractor sp. MCC625]MBT9684234.1 hypothetical protein [Pseudoflavonifractor sp. MCC625]